MQVIVIHCVTLYIITHKQRLTQCIVHLINATENHASIALAFTAVGMKKAGSSSPATITANSLGMNCLRTEHPKPYVLDDHLLTVCIHRQCSVQIRALSCTLYY